MARNTRSAKQMIHADIMIAGVEHMRALLEAMPQQLRTGILFPIVNTLVSQGARFARDEVRRVLPKRDMQNTRWDTPTGALANSLGSRVVSVARMRRRDVVFGLFGARMDFRATSAVSRNIANRRTIGLRGRVTGPVGLGRVRKMNGRTNTSSGAIQPHKYLHFVEFGHRKGKGPVAAQPYPFMRPARERLVGVMPGIVRSRWSVLYPQQIEKLKRRYMRRADIARQVEAFARRNGMI